MDALYRYPDQLYGHPSWPKTTRRRSRFRLHKKDAGTFRKKIRRQVKKNYRSVLFAAVLSATCIHTWNKVYTFPELGRQSKILTEQVRLVRTYFDVERNESVSHPFYRWMVALR